MLFSLGLVMSTLHLYCDSRYRVTLSIAILYFLRSHRSQRIWLLLLLVFGFVNCINGVWLWQGSNTESAVRCFLWWMQQSARHFLYSHALWRGLRPVLCAFPSKNAHVWFHKLSDFTCTFYTCRQGNCVWFEPDRTAKLFSWECWIK